MKPMKLAATNASRTTGQRRLEGWRAPTSASARSAASSPIACGSSCAGVAPDAEPEAGHQVGALARERRAYARHAAVANEPAKPREFAIATSPSQSA